MNFNPELLHQSRPTVAAASLPSTILSAGEKVLYRWTVTADAAGNIGWKKVVFDLSGSIQIGSDTYTIGPGPGSGSFATDSTGIYIGTSTSVFDPGLSSHKLVSTSSMTVWDVGTGEEVLGTTTDLSWYVHNYVAGGARVAFVARTEQTVSAGTTKTYEWRGDIAFAGKAGDSISTKIAKRSSATSTSAYATIVGNGWSYQALSSAFSAVTSTAPTFIWSDRAGSGTSLHTSVTNDWSMDYKVVGIPTATLSLSK